MLERWSEPTQTSPTVQADGKVPLEMPDVTMWRFGQQGTHAESDAVTVTPGAEHVAPDNRGENVERPDATATKRSGDRQPE
jgi:hypothetical protein